jgi:hypothetical protein
MAESGLATLAHENQEFRDEDKKDSQTRYDEHWL